MNYDFIIVGGGSAGCVLANRLSEDPSVQVLVIEAGRPDSWWELFIHMPAALTFVTGNKRYDWCYKSEPEPHLNGRRISHARGKILGGSSSINGMIFQRGNPMDFERWSRDPGLHSWDYAHCLPYFKRMEDCTAGADEFRSKNGPLTLERGPGMNPLFHAFLQATEQAGYSRTDDVNGFRQEGFSLFDRNIRQGRRWSAARAYFHPIKHRPNLKLKSRLHTSHLLMEGKRVTGVQCGQKSFSGNCVILAAGAINSPQILQLSGIGNSQHLEKVGVEVKHHLPGVGENLQDHLEVYIQNRCKLPVSMNPFLKWYRQPIVGLEWLFKRTGPAATNHFEAGGFARSDPSVAYPNLMLHFLPLAVRYDGSAPSRGHAYQVHVGPMYSNSRGSVRIASSDPNASPHIKFNYLSTEEDRREWLEAIQCVRKILQQPAFEPYNDGELSPGPSITSGDQILNWIRQDAETALHPSCTCKMGIDSSSVVCPDTMTVHGLQGLSVVDASVMPYITNGNIYAPVMMVAERAADIILGRQLLPPEHVEYYQASTGAIESDDGG